MVQGSSRESFFYFFGHLLICLFIILLPFPFFFYLLAGFNLFILLSRHSFGSCCNNKHISSYLLFVRTLTAVFFFFSKGPRGIDGFRGLKGSKV